MKKQSLLFTTVGLFIIASLAQSCQKAPSKTDKTVITANELLPADEKAAVTKCSENMIAKRKTFQLGELQTLALHDKMTLQNTAEHKKNYRQLAQKQVENCQSILDQFITEKITACLKSAEDNSQENSFSKDLLEKKCKTLGQWGKTVTQTENSFTETVEPKIITLKFSSAGQKLIQTKADAEYLYLLNAEIKNGKEQYLNLAQAGQTTCTLSSQSKEPAENSVFKYIAETTATKADIGFELKGKSSLITLQDSSSNVISLLCLNLEMSSEKERASSLKKIFGNLALIQEYRKDDARLNKDLAPPILKSDEKAAATEKAVSEAEKNDATDQTIAKARTTIQGVLKETLEEIKKTSLEISEGSISRAQKASESIVTNAVTQAQIAANEVIGTSITKTETAAINVIKASETTGLNLINASEATAVKVVDHSVKTAAITAAQVSENAILQSKAAGKELIQDSKIAANEVVDQGITKAKAATLETVAAPFKWIGEKTSDLWTGFTGFFSSSGKKENAIDIRKKIRN